MDELYMKGKFTDFHKRIVNEIHVESTDIINQSACPGGWIKLKFVLRVSWLIII